MITIYIYRFAEAWIGIAIRNNKIVAISFTFEDKEKLIKNIERILKIRKIKDEIEIKEEKHPWLSLIYKIFKGKENPQKIYPYLDVNILSDYEKVVLRKLWEIPYGSTRTYEEIALELKMHPRLIGRILSRNPFEIVFPCHRVVSKRGIGGFRGGYDDDKKKILEFEKKNK